MIKHLLITFVTLISLANVFGQKTEFRASLNSGLFSYAGTYATGTTSIYCDMYTKSGFTENPYGVKSGLCYGLSFNFKRLSRMNHFWGLDLGYEILRSNVSINTVYEYIATSSNSFNVTNTYNATGQTFLNNSYINLDPFIGHRYKFKQINFDLTAGVDMEYCLTSAEKGNATTSDGTKYTTFENYKSTPLEIRPRIHLQIGYKKMGLYFGNSIGIARSYRKGYFGYYKVPSNFIRFGITYLI
jgi:hypothetical protein